MEGAIEGWMWGKWVMWGEGYKLQVSLLATGVAMGAYARGQLRSFDETLKRSASKPQAIRMCQVLEMFAVLVEEVMMFAVLGLAK
jgi:hypothetical protein